MGYKKISDYGVIGDGKTVALIGTDGSVDWMCLPNMDSPSIFAAVLDDTLGGAFRITPAHFWDSAQSYLYQTNILRTGFRTRTGEVALHDFMPFENEDQSDVQPSRLVRRLEGISGSMTLRIECSVRFNYGRFKPNWRSANDTQSIIFYDDFAVSLWTSHTLSWENEQAEVILQAGDVLWLVLTEGSTPSAYGTGELSGIQERTINYWRTWVREQETGKYPVTGFWRDTLDRSSLALKLLQFRETGAIAAAPTCSIPTIIYGKRNWDYRFTWIRDTSMTLDTLFELGHTREVSRYMSWLEKILDKQDIASLNVLYQLSTPEPPSGEVRLDHLEGYKGSSPVLTGQYNIGQTQHDIYGELLNLFFSMSRIAGKIDFLFWGYIKALVEHVVTIWRDKDHGIWELRTGPHHVTHSKLMCWVALDRGIKIAEHYGLPADIGRWRAERKAVHADLLENGYNRKRGSFTQHYDTEELDASLLRIPLMGFLPIDDPRVANTIRAVEEELLEGGVVRRYNVDDGLPGLEHGFLICLFWYLRCLIRQNRFDEVEGHLRRIDRISNHLGLFGEQYDPVYKEITGNIPQAFSHIGYATTVLEYLDSRQTRPELISLSVKQKLHLFLQPRRLNPKTKKKPAAALKDPVGEVKRVMNNLRGRFYDGHSQKIDYPLIACTEYYRHFQAVAAALENAIPADLGADEEKKAFWINIFNTLVIHGVIALGIKTSVKEVPFFFDRVQYRVGSYLYTLSDIEHGILRQNRRPPGRLGKCFSPSDPRMKFCVEAIDPRIHFALVCASRTCPPVESYDASVIYEQLDTAATVFINGTSRVEQSQNRLSLSEIFKWYRKDFQQGPQRVIPFVANYLYDEQKARWLLENEPVIAIQYLPYDWRLNR